MGLTPGRAGRLSRGSFTRTKIINKKDPIVPKKHIERVLKNIGMIIKRTNLERSKLLEKNVKIRNEFSIRNVSRGAQGGLGCTGPPPTHGPLGGLI